MLETLKARKEQLEAQGKKGFTLMEMLIVIAIIAVLVAIAIPIFTAQLNNARVQSDAANIRSGYAVATAKVLQENVSAPTSWTLNSDGTLTEGTGGSFRTQGDATENQDIAGQPKTWGSGQVVTYSYSPSTTPGAQGAIQISIAASS